MDKKIEKTWLGNWRLLILISSIAVALISLWISVISGLGQYQSIDIKDIKIAEVTQRLYKDNIPIRGQVIPLETFHLTATEGGTIERIYAEDGQLTTQGQALIDLSNPNLQLRSIESEAQVGQQITALQQQELNLLQTDLRDQQELNRLKWEIEKLSSKLKRINQLKKEFVSDQEIESETMQLESLKINYQLLDASYNKNKLSYRSQIEKIKDSITYLEENLNFTRANLRNLKITSPIDGRLTAFNLEIGQSLNPGERIGQIDNPNQFKIVTQVQEFYQPQLKSGQKAILSFDNKEYELIVKKIYPQVEDGHIKIDLVFANSQPLNINRGQNLPLQLDMGKSEQALCIPFDSFIKDTGGHWIFVINQHNQAHKRFITTGRHNGEFIEIIDGLQKGEKVIISSYTTFSDALQLEIEN